MGHHPTAVGGAEVWLLVYGAVRAAGRLRSRPVPTDADRLAALLRTWLATELVVVDVGARWGVGDRWAPFGANVSVIGFDPDEGECARLNALARPQVEGETSGPRVVYEPVALGREADTATLHLTVEPACSSLYPPVEALVRQRPELSVIAPAGTAEVAMTTLDLWSRDAGVDRVDVMKLDTQGSELGVLEGAEATLAGVRLLEVEVEFNEIYEGQPLFGDVDRFLRARGFVLWRLQQLVHYGLPDADAAAVELPDRQFFDSAPVEVAGHGGQLFWGHAYFVAADLAFPGATTPTWDQAVRDACAATAFGFTDLARSVLGRATNAPAGAREALAGS
ncbi:MAG TPA: FkbM family methyltransferase [Acidimicrobiales bacterium]|nr:FkbM family methyltransferase [Acidimicrobiales bacterium]